MTDTDVNMNIIGQIPMDFSIGLLAYRKSLQEAQELWDKINKEASLPGDTPKKADAISTLNDVIDKPVAGPTKETLQHIASGNDEAAHIDMLYRTATGNHGDVVDISKLDKATQDKVNSLQDNIRRIQSIAKT